MKALNGEEIGSIRIKEKRKKNQSSERKRGGRETNCHNMKKQ